jgi:DNA-binding response OmpR family regulator
MFPTHLHGARVLVGEHDATLRARLHDVLRFHGADVADATTGRELLARLVDDGPFDAVIGDSLMQAPSCPEVIAMARHAGLDVAFIVIGRPTDETTIMPHRDIAVITDPFDERRVVAAVERAVARPHAMTPAKRTLLSCAACGHLHIGNPLATTDSYCLQCASAIEDDDEMMEYGGGD